MPNQNPSLSGNLTPTWLSNLTRRGSTMLSLSRRSSTASRRIPPTLTLDDFKNTQFYNWKDAFAKYNQLVTNQVSKDGSHESKDFARICKELERQCEGGFAHGLPEAVFDVALLWCPTERLHREPFPSKHPSWSWTGWKGEAEGEGGGVCFPFDPYSCPDLRRLEGNFFKSEVLYYNRGPEKSWTVRRRRDADQLRLHINYHSALMGTTPPEKETDTLRFSAFTISAESFKLRQLEYDEDKQKLPCSQLLDSEGKHCGNIMDYEELITAPDTNPRQFKYVLLSSNRRCDPEADPARPASNTAHPPGAPVWKDGRFLWNKVLEDFDEKKYQEGEWCMLNVMLIEYQEEGYWERTAVGQMHVDAWREQSPKREEITLK